MQIIKSYPSPNGGSVQGRVEEPSKCPMCHHAIKPQELSQSNFCDEDSNRFLSIHYLCKSCYKTFLATHKITMEYANKAHSNSPSSFLSEIIQLGPSAYVPRDFEASLKEMSPKFASIYNEALQAESAGLTEICGIGYRKALEFLIKDYLIHEDPSSKETIEKMELGNCITNKVEDRNIKATASRCAWIGNDQTHYVQKFEEYDLDMLKRLIDAVIYWVSACLVTEEALAIERR